jgi:hypothetical protein
VLVPVADVGNINADPVSVGFQISSNINSYIVLLLILAPLTQKDVTKIIVEHKDGTFCFGVSSESSRDIIREKLIDLVSAQQAVNEPRTQLAPAPLDAPDGVAV